MTHWPRPSATCILVGGEPLEAEYIASEAIVPGDLVEFTRADFEDKEIKPCTADSDFAIGFAVLTPNIDVTTGAMRGAKPSQAWAAGDSVKVVKGDCFVMAWVVAGEYEMGELLVPAASGELAAAECDTDNPCQIVAQVYEDVDNTAAAAILVNVRIN